MDLVSPRLSHWWYYELPRLLPVFRSYVRTIVFYGALNFRLYNVPVAPPFRHVSQNYHVAGGHDCVICIKVCHVVQGMYAYNMHHVS